MTLYALTHPTAITARGIENMVIQGQNSPNLLIKGGCALLSRVISVTVFPVFLTLELLFKRLPKMLLALKNPEKFERKADKCAKYALAIIPSLVLGLRAANGVPGLFLKSPYGSTHVCPFGVERQYGKLVDVIHYPQTVEELQELIKEAKASGKQVSVIGAGMSQGTQTVPLEGHTVINTKNLRAITLAEDANSVTVQSGATWEQLQLALNREGKSTIVKQASDPFSIGGSIGINCHGWAHESGAIASTVEALEVINAEGELIRLTPRDELFGCFFGTLGYFGVIVSATLRIVDNEPLIQTAEEIEIDDFCSHYETKIKGQNVPLFGGRLCLDTLEGDPLRKVCMVQYRRESEASRAPSPTEAFSPEPKKGTRIERIGLKLIANLSHFSTAKLLSYFWHKERASMLKPTHLTRNEALHPPINAFKMLHNSHLDAQWLQEYFIQKENLPDFLRFLGKTLKDNGVRLVNATIRPTPQDKISVLPYAEKDRYAVVICFAQEKTDSAIARTKAWIEEVTRHVVSTGDVYYQAYMPYATQDQFERCYGHERVERMRSLKAKYDPTHLFGNAHTDKYFDKKET